jgi:hypothetical protein
MIICEFSIIDGDINLSLPNNTIFSIFAYNHNRVDPYRLIHLNKNKFIFLRSMPYKAFGSLDKQEMLLFAKIIIAGLIL